ncbi:MAG: GC-type dockerin domain-anchored protein [Phycisphaerales bacterium]
MRIAHLLTGLTVTASLLGSNAQGQAETRVIDPVLTDATITPLESPSGLEALHVAAFDPTFAEGSRPNLLVVFVPGGGAVPAQYTRFAQFAASKGLHAIGIAYESWPSVFELIRGKDDPDLPEAIRRERLFGESQTELIEVLPQDSITARLRSALAYLDDAYPGEGWGRYLDDDGNLRWRTIVVAGHSQGAGHSAYLTKAFTLAGSIMFAGPGDFITGAGPAPWLFEPSQTPASRMFAFTHVQDPTAAGFFANQRILGLEAFGDIESVDRKRADQLSSHMLTSLIRVDHGNYHSAVVADDFLPETVAGENIYEPAWSYLLDEQIERSLGCRADIDADGALTLFDFLAFQNAFAMGEPGADFDGDGRLTLFDFLAFQNAFSQGCS